MDALQKTSTFNLPGIIPGSTLIIGLSGGPDSVYLLHQLVAVRKDQGLTLVAAHLDHEWRASSKEDVLFCQQLCVQLEVPLITKKASELTGTFTNNGSQEQLGRSMRRSFLESVRQEHNADAIVLAHHQDDSVETFFINLIRGTTTTGLGGIKNKEGFFVRPLLELSKQEIVSYLTEHTISYQTDPTNASDAYLRNRIRLQVIPALQACDDRAVKNIIRAQKNIADTETFLKKLTQETLTALLTSDGTLNLIALFALDPFLQKRVVMLWLTQHSGNHCRHSEAFLEEVLRFLKSERGGNHQIGPTLQIIKKQNYALLHS